VFRLYRVALRSFAIGLAVGVLFAPRPGSETRRILSRRVAAMLDRAIATAALPPVPADRARTNGHAERPTAKNARAGGDARTP